MARPFVPRTGVVPRAVTGRPERERCARRARPGAAVRDRLRAFRRADRSADLRTAFGEAGAVEERLLVDPQCSWDVSLPWVARVAALSVELLLGAHVEQRQPCLAQPALYLGPRRESIQPRLQLHLHRLELDLAGFQLARPGCDAA